MKKAILFLSVSLLVFAGRLKAQTYSTAVGAKFYVANGTLGGFNIKHSNAEHTALEGALLFGTGVIGLEGLYQYQGDIPSVPGLQYFVGGGGLLGFGTGKGSQTAFALRLTGGVDYKVDNAPIDVSLGLDPFFYLAPVTGSQVSIGLAFRYVLP